VENEAAIESPQEDISRHAYPTTAGTFDAYGFSFRPWNFLACLVAFYCAVSLHCWLQLLQQICQIAKENTTDVSKMLEAVSF
jgi:hypothetical protein